MALPAATSSKAIDKGLPETEATWGGTTDAESLTQGVVVAVDLPGPTRGQRHQGELRVDLVEQFLDGRVHECDLSLSHHDPSAWSSGAVPGVVNGEFPALAGGSTTGRAALGGEPVALHYTGHLGCGLRYVVIDDHGIGDGQPFSLLVGPGFEPQADVVLVIPPGPQPGLLGHRGGGLQQDQSGVRS